MKTYTLKIVTPVTSTVEHDVVKTIVRAAAGDIGIMAGHVPYVSTIRDGKIRVVLEGGIEKVYEATDGIVKVGKDETVILAQSVK